jgi:ABC-2 type transport system permease protein
MSPSVGSVGKHLRVIGRWWILTIQSDLAFHWYFFTELIDETASAALSLLLFDIAFTHAPTIAGWRQEEAILLVGVFQVYAVLLTVFLMPNLEAISRTVFTGRLDGLLLQPVSTQVTLSLRHLRLIGLLRFVPGTAIVVWALDALGHVPSASDILVGAGLLLCGVAIVYAVWFASLTVEFWCEGLWSMEMLVPGLFEYGRYPDGVFVGMARTVFHSVLPVVVVANYPLRALLGEWSGGMLLHAAGLALVFLILCRLQWRVALRRYSSASS